MSLPQCRDITTISASPILASHAPRVNRISDTMASDIVFVVSSKGTYMTSLRVIPSRDSRDISK